MKPQRKVLTLFEKTEIIKHLESGMSVTCASKKYKIAKSTVCALKKNKTNILNVAAKCVGSTHKRKTLKRSEMPILEKKLYRWFCNLRRKNIRVNTFMIKKKAKAMHEELKEKMNFTASDGWLQNFKKRFGIRFLKICGEELSSTPESVDQFKNELSLTLKTLGLTEHQIYNAAETGLFWKLLPNKTLVTCNEKRAPGRKVEKPRITFLACTNATGEHKIKPLVIGKARNPRCFKNYTLPVDYDYSKSAWMTAAIFSNWFHNSFVPQVRRFLEQRKLPAKAILILDNVPSHPPVEDLKTNDGNIVTIYMPPNVTPMCQNVIQLTKLFYRSNLLSLVVSRNSNQIAKSIKELNLKDAVINLSLAWDKVEPDVIKKCWENILIPPENDSDSKEDVPLEALREGYKSAAVEECMEDTGTSLNEIQPKV
ncbi:unnamed protein product [Tenebrio molitor]|nr:unnamed protein product [Tenebrio molitor]